MSTPSLMSGWGARYGSRLRCLFAAQLTFERLLADTRARPSEEGRRLLRASVYPLLDAVTVLAETPPVPEATANARLDRVLRDVSTLARSAIHPSGDLDTVVLMASFVDRNLRSLDDQLLKPAEAGAR